MASGALAKVEQKLERAKARAASLAGEYEETIREGVGVIAGCTTAALLGAAEEKFGEDAVFGVSVPMLVGIGGVAAGLTGVGGDASFALMEAGKAGLYVESFKFGTRMYADWASGDEPETTAAP